MTKTLPIYLTDTCCGPKNPYNNEERIFLLNRRGTHIKIATNKNNYTLIYVNIIKEIVSRPRGRIIPTGRIKSNEVERSAPRAIDAGHG